jgi:hypothetical protein
MISSYEVAARRQGWTLVPDDKGGRFERCASDEPECVWLCGDWQELCEFAAIDPSVELCALPVFTPPSDGELKALARKTADFILEIDPFGDRFSRREVQIIEAMIEGNPEISDCPLSRPNQP